MFFSKQYKISRFLFLFILILLKHETLQLVQISIASNGDWKKEHLQTKCVIPGTNIPNWRSTSMVTESLQIYRMIFSGKLFSSRDFMVSPNLCWENIKNLCRSLLQLYHRFLNVLAFFSRNSRFLLNYVKYPRICVMITEKVPALLICVRKSLEIMLKNGPH